MGVFALKPTNIIWRGQHIPSMVLGTAQLGMFYGIANQVGQPDQKEAQAIVKAAWDGGVTFFDTAQAYIQSQQVLGNSLQNLGITQKAHVITKLSPILDVTSTSAIIESVKQSCALLGVSSLWGLLLHCQDHLDSWNGTLGKTLRGLKSSGFIKYLGISVLDTEHAFKILDMPDMDIIQVPFNAWDSRMLKAGFFDQALSYDKLCFVRSIYLQGLLTMPPHHVAMRFEKAAPYASRWFEVAGEFDLSPHYLAMRVALTLKRPVVIGAETLAQIQDNLFGLSLGPMAPEQFNYVQEQMAGIPESVLDPFRWPSR